MRLAGAELLLWCNAGTVGLPANDGTYGDKFHTLWSALEGVGEPFWNQDGPRETDSNGNSR